MYKRFHLLSCYININSLYIVYLSPDSDFYRIIDHEKNLIYCNLMNNFIVLRKQMDIYFELYPFV